MESTLNLMILIPIFIIILMVVHRSIKQAFKLDDRKSKVLSICVSILATIGLNDQLKDSIGVILLPYATLAICILIILLLLFLIKVAKKAKELFFGHDSNRINVRKKRKSLKSKYKRIRRKDANSFSNIRYNSSIRNGKGNCNENL